MKILWIVNFPFGPLCELAGINQFSSGNWLGATFEALAEEKELEIAVATVSRVKELMVKKVGKHSFYVLPGGLASEYDHKSLKNSTYWEQIKTECQPDLIQIWGTEYTHGYLALKVMKDIPSLIYMQGLMSQIARHYLSGISSDDLRSFITVRDIIKWDWIEQQQSKFYRSSLIEAKMLQISGNVIVENEWCASHCKAIAPCEVYKSKLSIKEEFYNHDWSLSTMRPYTLMSNAGGYPVKGLHILLKALHLVKKEFPNVTLLIPGEDSPFEKTFSQRLRNGGYSKFLMGIIKDYNLKDNIVFLGKLTAAEMAAEMAKSNVFVMPSSIENHSSTLIEAMIVGVPCVSSYVGGIPEYLTHNVNGLLYRFEEQEILSAHIIKLFQDTSLAEKISLNAKTAMRNSRKSSNLKEELLTIYKNVLDR
jgi:glycosyltransferase involved in cell wall biosynthesis